MGILGLSHVIIGSILALLAPGYAWTRFLFRKDLTHLEQLMVSVAISVALVPIIVLYLNKFLLVGINPVNVFLTVSILTVFPFCLNKIRDFHQGK